MAKIISDPVYGPVEIAPVLPMVGAREFDALRGKYQLSLSSLVFPSATHTRFAHSIGSYHATRLRTDRWIKLGLINQEEGDASCAHALYHDIGHAAFSHVTEDLCPIGHKEMGVIHAENLRTEIEACGINHDLLMKLLRHEHPLWTAVADKNIGTEKLDYLERDGLATVQDRPMGISTLRSYVYFLDGKIVVDAKASEFAIFAQNFYMEMYKSVYFRKSLVIAQRMFQKMVHHLIVAGELIPHGLFTLTDAELLAIAFFSDDTAVRTMYDLLRRRELFKEAVVFRPEAFAYETRIVDKPIDVRPLSGGEMRKLVDSPLLQKANHASLEAIEGTIADCAGIPRDAVLLVPVFNPERFEAQDVNVLHGSQRKIQSLRELRPNHFLAMEETARSYTALRVCTLKEHRERLSSPAIAEKIASLLFGLAT
ncbi:MAG: hypothetical protein P4L67_01820 [Candidatus Pacebacteria bacterium]|nr:hypothetical protein [Candidatus Paceibacterota bacterium]